MILFGCLDTKKPKLSVFSWNLTRGIFRQKTVRARHGALPSCGVGGTSTANLLRKGRTRYKNYNVQVADGLCEN